MLMTNYSFWDRPTRFLRLGLAATVTVQLLVSLWMVGPASRHPATALEHAGFVVHEWVGLCALVIVLAHWLWSLQSSGDAGIRHLFPLDREGRREVLAELRVLGSGRRVEQGPGGGLAGLAHGLGLLAVTAIAATGGVLFVLLSGFRDNPALTHTVAHLHALVSNFVWVYWFGHVGMALLHQFRGDGVLRRMFSLSKD